MSSQRRAGRPVLPRSAPRLEWLAERRKHIGGSDIGSIVYDPELWPEDEPKPFGDAYAIWADKTGKTPLDQPPTLNMRRGQILEGPILQLWTELPENRGVHLRRSGLWVNWAEPLAAVTPDAICQGCAWGELGVVDGKSQAGDPRHWGTDWEPRIPVTYQHSGQWTMGVGGFDHHHFAVLGSYLNVFDRVMYPDETLWQRLLQAARTFWDSYVAADCPPEPTRRSADLLGRLWPAVERGGIYVLDPEQDELLDRAQEHKRLEERHKGQKQDLLARLQARIADATEIWDPTGLELRATWRPSIVIDGADADWVTANPELADQYGEERTTTVINAARLVAEKGMLPGLHYRRTWLNKQRKEGPTRGQSTNIV
jgi:predicted phage-related endonuclease